ncbi:hypothetical protein PybrP1_008587, partial [[Pythium] brassicae (nom. inval.)]
MLVEAQQHRSDAEIESESEEVSSGALERTHSLSHSRSLSQRKGSLHRVSKHEKLMDVGTEDSEDGDDSSVPPVSILRIWKLSAPEWKFLVLGGFGAVVNASVYPVWGVLLTKMTVLFFQYDKTKHDLLNLGFAIVSQKLVSRVRLAAFSAMLRQEIGWFDMDENASGALVARLATDSAILQAVTSDKLNQGLVNVTTLGIAMAIAFYYSWQMTLTMLAVSPIMILASYIEAKQMSGAMNAKKNNAADAAAGSLLAEAIGSIRTVASFSMEKAVNTSYVGFLTVSRAADIKTGLIAG